MSDAAWRELGRRLRQQDPEKYRQVLELIRGLVASLEAQHDLKYRMFSRLEDAATLRPHHA